MSRSISQVEGALWGFWFEEGSEVGLPVFSRHNKESPGDSFSFLLWD